MTTSHSRFQVLSGKKNKMSETSEDKFALFRLSVPQRQNVCDQIIVQIQNLASSPLGTKEKISQASKIIFGLNIRHVCIYKVAGKQISLISQYGCEGRAPFNHGEVKGVVKKTIDAQNPLLFQLSPDDLESVAFSSPQVPETKSLLVLPIKNEKNEIIGILELCSSIWLDFRKEEIENYISLAEQLSEMIDEQAQ